MGMFFTRAPGHLAAELTTCVRGLLLWAPAAAERMPTQAARFLVMASFGPRQVDIDALAARLKDDFGAHRVNVRVPAKGMTHLMFAVRVLAADQRLRWVTLPPAPDPAHLLRAPWRRIHRACKSESRTLLDQIASRNPFKDSRTGQKVTSARLAQALTQLQREFRKRLTQLMIYTQ